MKKKPQNKIEKMTTLSFHAPLVPASPLRAPLVPASPLRWGGLIEVMYTTYEESEIPDNIKDLRKRLDLLESSKTIPEIVERLTFTEDERNYLNSSRLDELFATIFPTKDFPIETYINHVGNVLRKLSHFKARDFFIKRNLLDRYESYFLEKLIRDDNYTVIGKIIDHGGIYRHEVFSEEHLFLCIEFGSTNAFREIIRRSPYSTHGFSIETAVKCMRLIVERGRKEMIDILCIGFSIRVFTEYIRDIVRPAFKNNQPEIIVYLIDFCERTDKYLSDTFYRGILLESILYGEIDLVKKLLKREEEQKIVTFGHVEALRTACSQGNIEMVKLLLEKGKAEVKKDDGNSLYICAERGYTEIGKILLENGADANCWNGAPMKEAVRYKHEEFIELLYKYGAKKTE